MKEGRNKTLPSLSCPEFEVSLDTTLQTDCLLQDSLGFDKGCHAALLNRSFNTVFLSVQNSFHFWGVRAMFILLIVVMVSQVCTYVKIYQIKKCSLL